MEAGSRSLPPLAPFRRGSRFAFDRVPVLQEGTGDWAAHAARFRHGWLSVQWMKNGWVWLWFFGPSYLIWHRLIFFALVVQLPERVTTIGGKMPIFWSWLKPTWFSCAHLRKVEMKERFSLQQGTCSRSSIWRPKWRR
jgi:hypothetical protein